MRRAAEIANIVSAIVAVILLVIAIGPKGKTVLVNWPLIGTAVFAFIALGSSFIVLRESRRNPKRSLVEITNRIFENQIVNLDGRRFRRCTFRNVKLLHRELGRFDIGTSGDNTFEGKNNVTLEGDNTTAILDLLKCVGLVNPAQWTKYEDDKGDDAYRSDS